MWRVLLGLFAVGGGASLSASSRCRGPSPTERTEIVLTQVLQAIELPQRASAGRCVDGLGLATESGTLSTAIDGWGRPLEIRCFGETLVLRSHGADVEWELDDLVLVRPMRAPGADSSLRAPN